MGNLFKNLFYLPLEKLTLFLYSLLGYNFGLAIIALTVLIRVVLLPLTIPAIRSSKKIQSIKGEVDSLKKRYKDDKARFQQEQLKLYQKHGINPMAGCLPILLQIPILIALYRVLLDVLARDNLNAQFLWLDLSKPDPYYILPVAAAGFQFLQSYMTLPKEEKKKEKSKGQEEGFGEMFAETFQKQNLYIMPLLWAFMLLRLPSGIGIYWVVSVLIGVVQQYFIGGPGKLKSIFGRKR